MIRITDDQLKAIFTIAHDSLDNDERAIELWEKYEKITGLTIDELAKLNGVLTFANFALTPVYLLDVVLRERKVVDDVQRSVTETWHALNQGEPSKIYEILEDWVNPDYLVELENQDES